MKRPLIILLSTLLAFSLLVTSAVVITRQISLSENAVTLREECFFGDRAAAEGITLRLTNVLEYHTLHRTTVTLGADDESTHIDAVSAYFSKMPEADLTLYGSPPSILFCTIETTLQELVRNSPLYAEMQAEAVQTGEPVRRTVRIADHIASLSLEGSVGELYHYEYDYPEPDPDSETYRNSWYAVDDRLAAAFHIPVDPTWQATYTLTYDAKGDRYHLTDESPLPTVVAYATRTEDAIYFYLGSRYSVISYNSDRYLPFEDDSFGLWRIPLDTTTQGPASVLIDQMTKVWTPDTYHNIQEVIYDDTSNNVFLLDYEHLDYEHLDYEHLDYEHPDPNTGRYTLLAVDPATDTLRYTLPLLQGIPDVNENRPQYLTLAENFAVFRIVGSVLLLTRNPDGALTPAMTIERPADDADAPALHAATSWITNSNHRHNTYRLTRTEDGRLRFTILSTYTAEAGFRIAVFEDGALVYHALYHSSLTPALKGASTVQTWYDYSHNSHDWYTSDHVPPDYFDNDALFDELFS